MNNVDDCTLLSVVLMQQHVLCVDLWLVASDFQHTLQLKINTRQTRPFHHLLKPFLPVLPERPTLRLVVLSTLSRR